MVYKGLLNTRTYLKHKLILRFVVLGRGSSLTVCGMSRLLLARDLQGLAEFLRFQQKPRRLP